MNEPSAGGPDTQKQPSRAESVLENGLSDAANAIADLIAQARAVDPAADEYGHARSRAYTDAVALLKASAKVGHTIAELRGSKFEHTINVRRENVSPGASANPDMEEVDDSPLLWLGKEALFDWKNKKTYRLEKPRADAAGEGTPSQISEGSNGNFESSRADEQPAGTG